MTDCIECDNAITAPHPCPRARRAALYLVQEAREVERLKYALRYRSSRFNLRAGAVGAVLGLLAGKKFGRKS